MTPLHAPMVVEWEAAETADGPGWHYRATFVGMDLVDLRFWGRGVQEQRPVKAHFPLKDVLALAEEAWMQRQAAEEDR